MVNLLKTISETLTKIGNWSFDRLSYGDTPDDEIPSKGEIRTIIIPEEVLEPDLDQFIEVGGRYTLATPFQKVTSNFPTVTTEASKIHGSRTAPQYHFLSLPTSLTTAQKQWLNKVKVVHSGVVVPSVLVPFGPTSKLPEYASEAAMLADQANQFFGEYYTYDSITYWLLENAKTEAIEDYISEPAVAGGEVWGTKPSYLIVQGDAYLVGENNVNELDFVYHELIKIDSVSYANVVVCTITSHTGLNLDPAIPDFEKLISMEFNNNDSDNSWYGENGLIDPFILFPENSEYIDLTGGNFSLRTNTSNNISGGIVKISIANNLERIIASKNGFTFITKIRRVAFASTSEINVFSMLDGIGNNIACRLDPALNRMRLVIGGSTRTTPDNFFTVEQDQWVYLAYTYSVPVVAGNVNFYAKAPDYTVPFTTITNAQSQGNEKPLVRSTLQAFFFNATNDTLGKVNNVEFDFAQFYLKVLSQAEIEAIWNLY